MGIYKKGNLYWFKKIWKGRRFEESLGTRNKKKAQEDYEEKLEQIRKGTYKKSEETRLTPGNPESLGALGAQPVPTMREVIEKYMLDISPTKKSHKRSQEIAAHLYDFLGNCLVAEVTKSKLTEYKSKRLKGEIIYGRGKGRKAGDSTVRKELSFLRQVLNKAMDVWDSSEDWNGYFSDYFANPVKKVIKDLKDQVRERYVTPAEAKDLANSLVGSRLKHLLDIAVVGCDTGLRESNIVNLKTKHCDFDNGRINLPGKEMKNGEPFSCKMTAEVKSTILSALKHRKFKSDYIFLDKSGQPYRREAVSMAFGRACKRAGITHLRFHDLRHDFASTVINNGGSLYQVQHALSQRDPRMAARYAHLLEENRNVVNLIEGKGTATILRQSAGTGG